MDRRFRDGRAVQEGRSLIALLLFCVLVWVEV